MNVRGKRLRVGFKMDKEHAVTRAPRGRHGGNPNGVALANHQRRINAFVGTNGTYGTVPSMGNLPSGVPQVAPGTFPITGYYPGNGMGYASLGGMNSNLGNGPALATYGQGEAPALVGGSNALNNSFGISPLCFPNIMSYNPPGYHGSAYVYHPSGSSHGIGGHQAHNNGL